MANITRASAIRVAQDFMKFVDASPSPYHVVSECKSRLIAAGFKQVHEHKGNWNIKPNDKIFVTKNQSSIIACAVGGRWSPGNGFTMLGAHTDSPAPRIKVVSKREKEGYVQVGTECYGGGNWPSWFDRDLKVAGRLMIRDESTGVIRSRLIDIDRPIMRIPHCAIHLMRGMNEKFGVNKETEVIPVISTTAVKKELLGETEKKDEADWEKRHSKVLMNLLADSAGVSPQSIIDFDLFLADHQPSVIGGAEDDFIFAPRIDNLLSMHAGLEGLVQSLGNVNDDENIRLFVGYDNEEVGSRSAQGAGSSFTEQVMRRLCANPKNLAAFEESIGKSMLLSADNCHAIHPNYPNKIESTMKPTLQGGPVISTSGAQNFATTVETATIVRELARKVDLNVQECMGRNDIPSGSTIGPVLATKLGIKTVDVGASQLSMHSCREMCGVMSPEQCALLYATYYQRYPEVNANIFFDEED